MATRASALADKLLSEGERTLTYFRNLPADARHMPLYIDGTTWTVRDAFEHLVISEESLQLLFEQVARAGLGVDEGFSTDQFNAEHTGDLAALSWDGLQARYMTTRQRTAAFTRGLSDAQLAIRARHPALADATLEEMLKLIYLHHSMHMRDIKRI